MRARNMLKVLIILIVILYPTKQNGDRYAWADETVGRPFKAITYNIHGGKKLSGESSISQIGQLLRTEQPDFIALQEVDRLRLGSGFQDQIDILSKTLGMEYIFEQTIKNGIAKYGIAILSRYPILESGVLELNGGRELRKLLWAKVYTEKGTLYLTSVHLDTDTDARPAHFAKILSFFETELTDAPVLLMGDLNALPDYPGIVQLQTSLSGKISNIEVPTYYHRKAEKAVQIDYIFGRGIVEDQLYTIPSDASDHTPLILLFHMGKLPYVDRLTTEV